ncbi:MAG: NirA family protein, partial [Burkholderiales bacterium]
MSAPDTFTEEQKQYLQGFVSGQAAARAAQGLPPLFPSAGAAAAGPAGPEAIHHRAQDRFLAAGKQLVAEEKAKRERHPLDRWDDIVKRAEAGQFPKGTDVFCTKFFGLFYVAPAQDSYMCRLRLPNGILSAHQLRGVADLAERYGGGYSHVTTRANLQFREVGARNAPQVLMGLYELGIVNRGSGADNIRNITGDPTAGNSAQELIDTRPLCREMHYAILNRREMYGLPRKFNIAFDGGGPVAVLEDTNDIGFSAVRVAEGKSLPAGVYFRVALGGITGHGDFARDLGIAIRAEQCVPVAAAIVRVYIEHGDRTDRAKARMKYVIDRHSPEWYLSEVEKVLGGQLPRLAASDCEPR